MTYDAFAKASLIILCMHYLKTSVPPPDYLVNDPDIIDAAFKICRIQKS